MSVRCVAALVVAVGCVSSAQAEGADGAEPTTERLQLRQPQLQTQPVIRRDTDEMRRGGVRGSDDEPARPQSGVRGHDDDTLDRRLAEVEQRLAAWESVIDIDGGEMTISAADAEIVVANGEIVLSVPGSAIIVARDGIAISSTRRITIESAAEVRIKDAGAP